MTLQENIYKYRDYLILAGLLIGALEVMEFLPETTDIVDLGTNVKFVYLGIIAIGVFSFHKFYWKRERPAEFQRTVAERRLPSDPGVRQDIRQQRGQAYSTPPPTMPRQQPQGYPPAQEGLWDKFQRE